MRPWLFSFLFGLSFFFTLGFPHFVESRQLSQEECPNNDIRDKMNPELRKFFSTPRDQGDMGWCYAFIAADMLSVKLGKPVSSVHVAAIYNAQAFKDIQFKLKTKKRTSSFHLTGPLPQSLEELEEAKQFSLFQGGLIFKAVEFVSKKGEVCTESQVPPERYVFKDLSIQLKMELIAQIRQIDERINKLNNSKGPAYDELQRRRRSLWEEFRELSKASEKVMTFNDVLNKVEQLQSEVANKKRDIGVAYDEMNSTLRGFFQIHKDFDELVSDMLAHNVNFYFSDMMDSLCSEKLKIEEDFEMKIFPSLFLFTSLVSEREKPDSPAAIALLTIKRQLEKGTPVGFGYGASDKILKNAEPRGRHISLITAQRWNDEKNTCEFKVRNTWGQRCSSYVKEVECIESEGSFWISDTRLLDVVKEINYLE